MTCDIKKHPLKSLLDGRQSPSEHSFIYSERNCVEHLCLTSTLYYKFSFSSGQTFGQFPTIAKLER